MRSVVITSVCWLLTFGLPVSPCVFAQAPPPREKASEAALPDTKELEAQLKAYADARRALLDARALLGGDDKALLLRREAWSRRYEELKANRDATASFLDIATEQLAQATNAGERARLEANKKTLEKQAQGLDKDLAETKAGLDASMQEYREKVGKIMEPLEQQLSAAQDALRKTMSAFERDLKLATQKRWRLDDAILPNVGTPLKVHQFPPLGPKTEWVTTPTVRTWFQPATRMPVFPDLKNTDRAELDLQRELQLLRARIDLLERRLKELESRK